MNNKQCPVICFISLLLFWLLWSSHIQSNTYKHVYFGCKIRLFDADSLLRPPPPLQWYLEKLWHLGTRGEGLKQRSFPDFGFLFRNQKQLREHLNELFMSSMEFISGFFKISVICWDETLFWDADNASPESKWHPLAWRFSICIDQLGFLRRSSSSGSKENSWSGKKLSSPS